jgi:hypothetical protein
MGWDSGRVGGADYNYDIFIEESTSTVDYNPGLMGATPTIFVVQIDARNNTGENVVVRLYDESSSPTVGTTPAHMLLPCPKGKKVTWHFLEGETWTATLGVATIAYGSSGSPGATSGTDSPTGKVSVRIGASN